MPVQTRITLKSWFLRGLKPLANQFADWMDSYWHKNDDIPMANVLGLNNLLSTLTTIDRVKGLYRDEIVLRNNNGDYILNESTCVTHFVIESDVDISFKIGDTAGGEEILAALVITANDPKPTPIVLPVFAKMQRQIFFSGITGTGATVKITILKNSN